MKKIDKNTYNLALQESLLLLKKDLVNFKFVALLGSVREKEHIPIYSDLDILFVIESTDNGVIDFDLLIRLQKVCSTLSKKYKIKISFLTHTEKDFIEYVEYEYLVHYSFGKVLYGNKKVFSRFFDVLISNKKPNKQGLVKEMYLATIHARFNLIRKFVSLNVHNTKQYRREIQKLFIDNLFEIADWRLISENIWCKSKKEIMQKITEVSSSNYSFVLSDAYKYRNSWETLVVKEADSKIFLKNSVFFINDCVAELKKSL